MTDAIAMKGGGYYSLATIGAKDVIDAAAPLVREAIARMPDRWEPFLFADFGTADGGTSLDLVAAMVENVKRRWPGRELALLYTDQPRNDFNALVATIHERPAADGVYPLISATSFYHQVLPAGSLDLGFSATAMHWLSRKPCEISDHVQAVGASGDELAAFAEQGNDDWQTILLHRARELTPGGRLVLVNFCRDEAGRYLGNTGGINMFDRFNEIWREFLAAGIIGEAEYRAMTLAQYYKSLEEFTGPLTEVENPVYQSGLRLEHVETRITPCPFAAAFRDHGDAVAFAKAYVPTLRSWTESSFLAGLDPARPLGQRRLIIDRYFAAYEEQVHLAPEGHGMDYVHVYMMIARA